ncbi:hypothetical protein JCM6882_005140 [Rhodosporidiobolus microsporus]
MSSSEGLSSYVPTIALVAAGLAGGYALSKLAGAAPQPAPPTPSSSSQQPQAGSSSASKNKKKKKSTPSLVDQAQPALDRAVEIKDQAVAAASTAVKQVQEQPAVQRATKAVQDAAAQAQAAVQPAVEQAQQAVAGAAAAAGSKSKKGKKGKKASPTPSPAPTPAPQTAAAEAQAAKTAPSFSAAVDDDMRDEDVDPSPQVARTMKIVGGKSGADPKSLLQVPGQQGQDAGWESADGFDEDDGAWESVVSKKPSRPTTPSGNGSSASSAAAQRVVPGLPQQALTKKQRENAAKKSKEQAAKDEKDREQEERLKAYRREQDKAKLAADNLARSRARPRSQNFFGSEPQPAREKVLGGGMSASLDPASGSLVWD